MASALETLFFRARPAILAVLALFTLAMGWSAWNVHIDAGFVKQLPVDHPYVKTFLDYQNKLPGTNSVTIIVESKRPTIWTQKYLRRLYDVTEAVFYLPGVFRGSVQSLWTPGTQVLTVTEGGFDTHNLIPADVTRRQMSDEAIHRIHAEADRQYWRGSLYSLDHKSAVVNFDLQDIDPRDGSPIDYIDVAQRLDRDIRQKYTDKLSVIHIVGFAPLIGEIANAARNVVIFFVVSFLLTTAAVYMYSRAWMLTGLAVLCSGVSVVWQFGLISLWGMKLDPLAILVPFLVYAIGVSHGIQQINLITSEIIAGRTPEEAARATFTRLLVPGSMALMTALTGFMALWLVPIPMIREMAAIASLGVALKIVSNLVMLPLIASYLPPPRDYARRMAPVRANRLRLLSRLESLAEPRRARIILAVAAVVLTGAVIAGRDRVVGDLQPGIPELRQDARYNVDQRYYAANYNVSLDNFVVIAETAPQSCIRYADMRAVERFSHAMAEVEGVRRVISLPEVAKIARVVVSEGNLKWHALPISKDVLTMITTPFPPSTGLIDNQCNFLTVAIFLDDHKAHTLDRVAAAMNAWVASHPTPGIVFRAATGNGGLFKAMNDAVSEAEIPTLAAVYAVVIVLVLLVYRDWRAVLCCCSPLLLATFLGYDVMLMLGIGLKISTLPVLALATGIGVDYAFYIYSRLLHHQGQGMSMAEAYGAALRETGMAVIFTGLTLALGVVSWIFSDLKFQADMGLLLAFMFIVNMIGAVTLLPAIAVTLDRVAPRRMAVGQVPEPA